MKDPFFIAFYLSKWSFLPALMILIIMAIITASTYQKYKVFRQPYVFYRFFFINWTFVMVIHYVFAIAATFYYKKNMFDYRELYSYVLSSMVYILLSLGSILAIYSTTLYVYGKMYLDIAPNNRMAFLIAITCFAWIYLLPLVN